MKWPLGLRSGNQRKKSLEVLNGKIGDKIYGQITNPVKEIQKYLMWKIRVLHLHSQSMIYLCFFSTKRNGVSGSSSKNDNWFFPPPTSWMIGKFSSRRLQMGRSWTRSETLRFSSLGIRYPSSSNLATFSKDSWPRNITLVHHHESLLEGKVAFKKLESDLGRFLY